MKNSFIFARAFIALFTASFLVEASAQARESIPEKATNLRISTFDSNAITHVSTQLVVPPVPVLNKGTIFIWPGLQPSPGGANFAPIDNGVLQPVLTWGPSCAPGFQPAAFSTWWISGQYVNTFGKVPGYSDCNGGEIMSVNPGDVLQLDFFLDGTVWRQKIRNLTNDKMVSYAIDMRGQAQIHTYFQIEPYEGAYSPEEVVFLNTVIEYDQADSVNCVVQEKNGPIKISKIRTIKDGKRCTISKIVMKQIPL